jgi:hypothetical protein
MFLTSVSIRCVSYVCDNKCGQKQNWVKLHFVSDARVVYRVLWTHLAVLTTLNNRQDQEMVSLGKGLKHSALQHSSLKTSRPLRPPTPTNNNLTCTAEKPMDRAIGDLAFTSCCCCVCVSVLVGQREIVTVHHLLSCTCASRGAGSIAFLFQLGLSDRFMLAHLPRGFVSTVVNCNVGAAATTTLHNRHHRLTCWVASEAHDWHTAAKNQRRRGLRSGRRGKGGPKRDKAKTNKATTFTPRTQRQTC